jgi:hypothetical protein
MTTKSLFSQNIDVSGDFPTWNRRFKSSWFDKYSEQGNKIEIRHDVNRDTKCDEFFVVTTVYQNKGCLHGKDVSFGKFDTFADAVACANCAVIPTESEVFGD